MCRAASLFLLFAVMNLFCFMLEGPGKIVGELADQTGSFASLTLLLQPWIFLVLWLFVSLPEAVFDSLFRYRLEGAPLFIVLVASVVSAACYEGIFRLPARIRWLRTLASRIPRFVPITLYLTLLLFYVGLAGYVGVSRHQREIAWQKQWDEYQKDLSRR